MTIGQQINALPVGKFLRICKTNPAGSIEARRLASGAVNLYWRITHDGKTDRHAIGVYDSRAPVRSVTPTERGHSIESAKTAAQVFATQHLANREQGGYTAIVKTRQKVRADADEAQRLAGVFTLAALLADYCDHLAAIGRRSHSDARSIFSLHVSGAWPKVAAMPARDVTSEHVADMMRTLMEAGKGRTANKLRSYVSAAFQTAKKARLQASIPVRFKGYGVIANPAADTLPDETSNKPDKNPLTLAELRAYWGAINRMDGFKGALLRLHLLTGGQRIEQLARLRAADIGAGVIVLHDGKGRPGRPPRPHTVPLTGAAALALSQCKPAGEFALSTDGGKTHVAATSLSKWAAEAAGDLVAGFTAKRIRSGVETALASARVSQDIRGRLQSHGVAGVQARHYDGHDYLEDKRQALDVLFGLLASQ